MNINFKHTAVTTVLLTSFVTSYSMAADIAIVGGTVHTMTKQGVVKNATVLINDDKIKSIGVGTTVPAGYKVIDAKGKVVTPGFIGAYTGLGLVEVSMSAGTVDSSYSDTKISAALDVSYAVNPDSTIFDITRIEGFTSAATVVNRSKTLFQGQGAFITLGDEIDSVEKARAFMAVDLSNRGADNAAGGTRAALWVQFRNALNEGVFAAGKKFTPSTEWHGSLSKADAKALVAVVQGKTPLLVKVDRAADIRQLIRFKSEFKKLDITLVGADEAWRVASELAENNISVILNPESNLPYSFESLGATLAAAGRLEKAGVTVAIGIDTHNIRLAAQSAGNAVANGLSWEGGLASLTTAPAKIYNMDDQYGSLGKGMKADVVVWSGDPLEVMEAAEHVIINGKEVSMESRQTRLRDRYLSLDAKSTHHYNR